MATKAERGARPPAARGVGGGRVALREAGWLTGWRVLGWGSVVGLLLAAAWRLPISPLAMHRADAALAAGEVEEAADRYVLIAEQSPWPEVAREAMRRAIVLYLSELHRPIAAQDLLQRRISDKGLTAGERAAAWEQLGQLLLVQRDEPEGASGAFRQAFEVAKDDPQASDRLLWAARAMVIGGNPDAAFELFQQVSRRFPDRKAEALVGMGDILLRKQNLTGARGNYANARLDLCPPPPLTPVMLAEAEAAVMVPESWGCGADDLGSVDATLLRDLLVELAERGVDDADDRATAFEAARDALRRPGVSRALRGRILKQEGAPAHEIDAP